jgi:hypothetical protein
MSRPSSATEVDISKLDEPSSKALSASLDACFETESNVVAEVLVEYMHCALSLCQEECGFQWHTSRYEL